MPKVNLKIRAGDTKRVQEAIQKLGDEATKSLDNVTRENAREMVRNAKRGAPLDTGKLRQGIFEAKTGPGEWFMFADKFYTPFQEFGTITKVKVPAGLEDLAIQFKGAGILKTGGIKAKLFMYKAWVKQGKTFKKDIDNLLKRLTK